MAGPEQSILFRVAPEQNRVNLGKAISLDWSLMGKNIPAASRC
jgi:hypothetical protein